MNEYNLEYLQNLVDNGIEESLHFEYKASSALRKGDSKKSKIPKNVSAMANSDGEFLIYGIKEDQNNKHLPKEIESVSRKDFPKEWLEQIFPISIEDDFVIYIVDIPKSNTAH